MKRAHNKAFKRDSCRVAFLVCVDFRGESGVRKVVLGGIHPLTRRYTTKIGHKDLSTLSKFMPYLYLLFA
ncbi:TPA: DUF3265 domain-containing protein [Vibrio vulnificus]|nr:DUF3265 domain-containing protein [Vibrio vulnificus]HDY7878383.1 DUF3265 domain-containing protein [Vibrio vulnificus]